ncbi:MAG: hydrogenase maturation nickel metallochaperone HypA [Desulfobacteraceae bacterium]|nr:hydrogenase maturation nickel metallochaperone HypA [Desulfobacteraceae bacterium]
MHEMGIARQIIEIATSSIPAGMEDIPVERVNLKVGKLSSVVPDSLRFCFEILAKDTTLSSAELNIEEIPVVVMCTKCKIEWTINEPIFICKNCKSSAIEIISGQELDVISIEVADPDTT